MKFTPYIDINFPKVHIAAGLANFRKVATPPETRTPVERERERVKPKHQKSFPALAASIKRLLCEQTFVITSNWLLSYLFAFGFISISKSQACGESFCFVQDKLSRTILNSKFQDPNSRLFPWGFLPLELGVFALGFGNFHPSAYFNFAQYMLLWACFVFNTLFFILYV